MEEIRLRVLVCPLDWGLGHATRCVPLIRLLLKSGVHVLLAGTGRSGDFLKSEFPMLTFAELPGETITYSEKGLSVVQMLMQFPSMLLRISKEHRALERIVMDHQIDMVISDNRYGLYTHLCKTVFITHQLSLKVPAVLRWLTPAVNAINSYYIRKFDRCWVPDTKNHSLAGSLSVNGNGLNNIYYAEAFSRFYGMEKKEISEKYDVLVILSGPEPQRSVLEEKITVELIHLNKKALIVQGIPAALKKEYRRNIHLVNHLPAQELFDHLKNAQYIICRSGYSSIMDLAAVGRSAIIIPTPGQSEQEYLADLHHGKKHHLKMTQNKIDLLSAFSEVDKLAPLVVESKQDDLLGEVKSLMNL